jgi:hypothetical protein
MLQDRIMGALMFKRKTYAEVETDESFTQTAWMLAGAAILIGSLGTFFLYDSIVDFLIAAVVGVIFGLLGFAVGAWVIAFVGKSMFQADVTFDEVVRVLGLASIWNILGIFGLIPLLGIVVGFAVWVAGVLAYWIAIQEALDLDTVKTVVVVVIGFVATVIVSGFGATVLAVIGIGAGSVAGLLGG